MVRKAFSLVCSIAALIGIAMTGMPAPIKIILAVVVVSFMIFVISTGLGKRGGNAGDESGNGIPKQLQRRSIVRGLTAGGKADSAIKLDICACPFTGRP
jgi:hypothetical protein